MISQRISCYISDRISWFRGITAAGCVSLNQFNISTISKANNSIILGNNFLLNRQSWLSLLSRQSYLSKKFSSLIYQSNETWYCTLNGARPAALAGSRLENAGTMQCGVLW